MMKDDWFAVLIDLFEKTLAQIKETRLAEESNKDSTEKPLLNHEIPASIVVKSASEDSIRVYSELETLKLSKASYQFLVRLSSWNVVSQEILELVLHQLNLSEDFVIGLSELKWNIRKSLAGVLDANELSYLDLILYQPEDKMLQH